MKYLIFLTLICSQAFADEFKDSVMKSILSKESSNLKFVKNSCDLKNVTEFLHLAARTDVKSGKDNSYHLECKPEETENLCRFIFSVKGKEGGPVNQLPWSNIMQFEFDKKAKKLVSKSLECFTSP
jgi:hypothetical protein